MADAERPITKKKKFVRDGIFYAELNELFSRELAADGYAGVEVRLTPARTEIVIMATRTQNVLGEKGRRIRELTALVQKRFNFQPDTVELYVEAVKNKALSALAQAEAVKFRLSEGLSVRRAANSVLRFIMDNPGARGCEIIVSGKLRGQRAKGMKFKEGYMICSGDAKNYYIDEAVKHLCLRQGVLGIKVKIMLAHDPTGIDGPAKDLPDIVKVLEPKPHEVFKPDEPEPQYQGGGYDDQGGYYGGQQQQQQYDDQGGFDQPPPQDQGTGGPEMGYGGQADPQAESGYGQDPQYEQQAGGYQPQEYQQETYQDQPPPQTGDYQTEYPQTGYEQQPQQDYPQQDYPPQQEDYGQQQQQPQQQQDYSGGYAQGGYDDSQQQGGY